MRAPQFHELCELRQIALSWALVSDGKCACRSATYEIRYPAWISPFSVHYTVTYTSPAKWLGVEAAYFIIRGYFLLQPVPVAALSKAQVSGCSPAEIVGSNPAGCSSIVSVVYCQVDVSMTSWFLVQRSPTKCSVSLCVI